MKLLCYFKSMAIGICGHKSSSLYSSKRGWICDRCVEKEWQKESLKEAPKMPQVTSLNAKHRKGRVALKLRA